jgi:gluconokinase
MGVSGVGKTSVGMALAAQLGVAYVDGDDLHPPVNLAKMRGGIALTDADRAPWLDMVGRWLRDHEAQGGVVSCSALRRSYRDTLRSWSSRIVCLQLDASPRVLVQRIDARVGHFMPSSLLTSQLSALEPLAADEPGTILVSEGSAEAVAALFVSWLGHR